LSSAKKITSREERRQATYGFDIPGRFIRRGRPRRALKVLVVDLLFSEL